MRYLSFQGRLSRAQYWRGFWGIGFACGAAMIAATVLPGLAGASSRVSFWILGGVMLIAVLGAGTSWTSMSVRRAHDLGHSGSWLLISPFRAFQLVFREGEPRENRYGPAPAESRRTPTD